MRYYIHPPIELYSGIKTELSTQKSKTYTEYNYSGAINLYLKTRHFEACLKLTKKYFHQCNVIDFACADGPFIPSLSKYFNYVVGIDILPDRIALFKELAKSMGLNNVTMICNKDLSFKSLRTALPNKEFKVLFFLEALEHIGDKDCLYESKIEFLEGLFTLLEKDGIIVISVPRTVGIHFLFHQLGAKLLRLYREPFSLKDIFKAAFLYDTSELEKKWNGGHLGFNHRKLETFLKRQFQVLKVKDEFFQKMYIIKRF